MVHVHCIVHAKKKLLVKEIDFHPIPQIKKKEENPHPHLQERNSNPPFPFISDNPPPHCRIKTVDCPAVCKSVSVTPNCKTLLVSFTVCQKQKQLIKSNILAENWY